ncbi:hypothetical protein SETIT_3G320900v2 [Setaria italica]|uniref:Uncharacterized protein n=1 Tax=Setaria italica TaxID=4555 RepID=K3ZCF6_SETIT|nr:hypothetical protein SETIT_3G320900v2 [Setaria italica]
MPTVQWCGLPTEIWGEIISRIDVLVVMSFSSTCKSLESVCKTLGATILKSGSAILVTSQLDQDGWGVEDDLKTGKFGLHDVSNTLSFCCVNEGLQRRIWLGGKGDWLVSTNPSLDVPLPSFGNNLHGIELQSYRELSVIFPPFARDIRRVVLSRTPSHADGYEAIALFSDGLLTYIAEGENVWRVLKNPTDHDDNAYNYYLEVSLDVIVYHGWVIAIEEDGDIFAWHMSGSDFDTSAVEHVFYLAISPSDQLILACLYGHDFGHNSKPSRMVWNEHDRFEQLDSISMFEFDDANVTWRRISSIGKDQSLFLGLNYPFFVTSTNLKGNSIYVADVGNYDVGICSLGKEGQVSITKQDFPVDEKAHLLKGWTIRTLMWFRPTTHAKAKNWFIFIV